MYRKCEICGHEDIETQVYASAVGPMSFNYCLICSSVMAESKNILDVISEDSPKNFGLKEIKYYDEKKDIYRFYSTNEEFKLLMTSGRIFATRHELVEYLKGKIE